MSREKQIKSSDWLTEGYSKEELARIKDKAIEEAVAELRDKQINEMAKHCHFYEEGKCLLLEDEAVKCDTECDMCEFAKRLYNAGYRKQSENVIELPCKVGTTLYFLYNSPYADKPDLTPRIYQTTDWYFEIDKTGIVICTSDIHSFNKKYDYFLGATVFFTKEEAEKAIAELKKKYTEEGK